MFSAIVKIKKNRIAFAVFAVLTAVLYGNTLGNGFVLDDFPLIAENPYIQSLKYLPKVITGCTWEFDSGGCKGKTALYRPIHSLSLLLTWQVSSKPWFFHLVTLLFFLIAASLVFVFVKSLTKNFLTSFLAGLLFIIHPVNNEVANWISAVSESTFIIFSLLTFIFYIKLETERRKTGNSANFFLVYLSYFFAILSKEISLLIIPCLIFLLDVLVFQVTPKKLLARAELKKYIFFAAPVLAYLIMRISVLGGISGLANGGGSLTGISIGERIYAFFILFIRYLKELLYPYPLIFFREFNLGANLLTPPFILSFFAVLAFAAIFYLAVKKKKRIVAFSFAWIFIFSLPTLILFNFSGRNVFFGRYLLGSSIGFVLLIAYFLGYLYESRQLLPKSRIDKVKKHQVFRYLKPLLSLIQSQNNRRLLVHFIVVILIAVSFLTVYPRNKTWKDNATLIRANTVLNPDAEYANLLRDHLADFLRRRGNIDEAVALYKEILGYNVPEYHLSPVYTNLAFCYRTKGDLVKAEEYYKKAAEYAVGANYAPLNNLGAFYMERGEYLKALLNFCLALIINPQTQEPQSNMNRIDTMFSDPQVNLDRIITLFSGLNQDNLQMLYKDITAGSIFQKNTSEKIRYQEQACSDKNCSFIFTASFSQNDVVLPFLIIGSSALNEVFRPEEPSFNPQTGQIILQIPLRYKNKTVSFIFPTCGGIYYEVIAKPQ